LAIRENLKYDFEIPDFDKILTRIPTNLTEITGSTGREAL
jgi:hypothetical protein